MGLLDFLTAAPESSNVKLPSLEKTSLRESFFHLLKDFSTFPAARNFFLVKLHSLPAALTDENQKKLGITKKLSERVDNWSYDKLDEINRIVPIIKEKMKQNGII